MKKTSIIGIIILISISPLFRGLFFNYESYAFLAALALLSIVYFFSKMMKSEPFHINKWFAVFGILLIAAAALSFIKAVNARENLEYILQYAEYLVIFIILYDYFHDSKQRFINALMLPVVFTGFVCSVVGLMALTGSFSIWDVTIDNNRIGSTFQNANPASIYFAICFLFTLTLMSVTKSNLLRAILAGMGNVLIFTLFLTGSRGGYIVGVAAILLLLVIQPAGNRIKGIVNFICVFVPVFITLKSFNMSTASHDNLAAAKWLAVSFLLSAFLSMLLLLFTKIIFKDKSITMPKRSGFIFAIAVAAVVIFAFINRHRLITLLPPILSSRLAKLSFNDINVLYRLQYDKDALKLIAGNWLFGLGGGGWKALYQSVQDYFYIATFVHNIYLQVFVENGIFGFLSYTILVVTGLLNALYSWLKAKDKIMKIYAGGLLCGLLALAVHSAFDFDLSYTSMSLLLWVMFAAVTVGLPAIPGAKDVRLPLLVRKHELPAGRGISMIAMIVICSVLLSMYAVYLTGAYNAHEAQMLKQSKDYNAAAAYFEEAYRLDPGNSDYAFELTKLYNYFSNKSNNAEDKKLWLEKARSTGEKSVSGNKYFPAHMNTLILTYIASDMPLQALDYAQKLVQYQPYYKINYELLAQCYITAAKYYDENKDIGKARDMLEKCIAIDKNPYLLKSNVKMPYKVLTNEELNDYKHSKELLTYLKEASELLTN